MAIQTLLTADDLLRLPRDGKRYELAQGELVEMASPGDAHGETATTIACILGTFMIEYGLGSVRVESGFPLSRQRDTVRAPESGRRSRPPDFWGYRHPNSDAARTG